MKSKWWRFWPLMLLALAYAPALLYSHAHHDQYRYFRISPAEKTSCEENTQHIGLAFDLGRPVTAALDCLQFKTAHTLSDLTWHRALTLLLILAFAYVLSLVFQRRWNFSAESSGLLAAVICVIPGLLNQFIMTNHAVFVAHILVTWAFLIFDLRPKILALTFLLFTVAVFTYQPAAFLLVALAFADFLIQRSSRLEWRRLIAINLIALVSSIIYFAVIKLVFHPYVNYSTRYAEGQGWGGSTYAFNFSSDLWGRLSYFGRAMNAVLNFWNIYPSLVITVSVLALVVFLSVRRPTFKLGVAFVGLLASFAPLLAANISVILYRSLFVVSAYSLLVLIWLIKENFKVRAVIARTIAIAALGISSFNVTMTARNSKLEIDFLKNQILDRRLLDSKIILFKNVYHGHAVRGINGLPSVGDEFNVNSTSFYEDEVLWIMRAAFLEAGAGQSVRVASCANSEDCTKAELALRHVPNVYVIARSDDFSGYPLQYPVIDMSPHSR